MSTAALVYTRLPCDNAICVPVPHLATADYLPVRRAAAPVTDGGVHPGAIGLALAGFGLFLAASWAGWAFGYTALLIAVVTFLAMMYFGLLVGGGAVAAANRGERTHRSFREFLAGRVQTFTGALRGRDALVQIAFMPVLLGCTMGFFAVVWLSIR